MKTLYTLVFSYLMLYATAQDVLITVTGLLFVTPLEIDTIKIENLSNGTNLSLTNFPSGVVNYGINLSQGTYNSMDEYQLQKENIELFSNRIGKTQILIKLQNRQTVTVEVFDVTGRKQLQSDIVCHDGNNIIEVKTNKVSLIRVRTKKSHKVFKSIGKNSNGAATISKGIENFEKSCIAYKDEVSFSEFVYSPGDSLKIITIKNNYHSGFIMKTPVHLDHYYVYLSKPCSGAETLTDYDGNIYKTVQIGTQCWMKENLNTTHYADGTPLVDGTGIPTIDITTKYWFNYDDNPANAYIYGKLYSWAAVMNDEASSDSVPSGVQGVCPEGWHVPSKAEWEILVEKFGGNELAGGKLKESGYEHWSYPNSGANNLSGFTALPGGRLFFSYYDALSIYSYFSSSTYSNYQDNVWICGFEYNIISAFISTTSKQNGLSIRCIKD